MEFTAVVSSNINGVAYDKEARQMYVEFSGGLKYKYSGMSPDTYEDFLDAPSKGEFFAQNIKGQYPYTRA